MAAEPEYRFAIVYLLLLRLAIVAIFSRRGPATRLPTAVRSRPRNPARSTRFLLLGLFVLPLVLWAAIPPWLETMQLDPHPVFRWLALAPAAAAILLSTWAGFGAATPESQPAERSDGADPRGPYRWIRYPQEAAQVLFYVSVAWLTANAIPLLAALIGGLLVRCVLVSQGSHSAGNEGSRVRRRHGSTRSASA